MPNEFRTEFDSMGPIRVPADRLYGAQTARSLVHFAIGADTMPRPVVRAFGTLKKAAALVNHDLGLFKQKGAVPVDAKVKAVCAAADEVTAGLEGMEVPLRVAVMGCVVNGPGEARDADLGVASGNGKGQIFVKGEVIKTVPESQIVETLIEEAMRIAEEMGEPVDGQTGAPSVTVG